MKETLLSAEQQRKYDYFFLEAMRMKMERMSMMRHLDCYSIVWISTPLLLLRFMKYRNIICPSLGAARSGCFGAGSGFCA